jgi:hypothetical protein
LSIEIFSCLRQAKVGDEYTALQAMLQAALQHAEDGKNMAHAVYVAARLKRYEKIPSLVVALKQCAPTMNILDLDNILWGCAMSNTDQSLTVFLDRLHEVVNELAYSRRKVAAWTIAQLAWSLATLRLENQDDTLSAMLELTSYDPPAAGSTCALKSSLQLLRASYWPNRYQPLLDVAMVMSST